jgi:hypothetical protein
MKKYLLNIITAFALILTAATMFSCTDPCDKTICQNGGVCSGKEGTCFCPAGYEGVNCESESRTKFYGDYKGTLTIGSTSTTESIRLESYSGNVQRLKWDLGHLEIVPNQPTKVAVGCFKLDQTLFILEGGSGSLNGSQLVLNFTASTSSGNVNCSFIGTK